MLMYNKNMVIKNIEYSKDKKLGVAVSGGRDSMALLHILINKFGAKNLIAINVEHGLRGKESVKESEFVKEFCDRNNVECICRSIDTKKYAEDNKLSIEQSARDLRYQVFDDIYKKYNIDKIALAHHSSDQCETILMRIFRGTGLKGLNGIKYIRDNKYIRPLLDYSRADINRYIKKNEIPYVDDSSNRNTEYTRNFIRNKVIPVIKQKYPDYEKALIRLSETASQDEEYIMSHIVEPELDGNIATLPVDVLDMHKSIASRSIYKAFSVLDINVDIETRHIDTLLKMKNLNNGDSLDMPYNIKVYLEYDKMVFVKNTNSIKDKVLKFNRENIKFDGKNIKLKPYTDEKLRFDLDKIPDNAVIRYRKNGDFFIRYKGKRKSLGDYFTDSKIPRRLRNDIPLIAVNDEILIIIGYEISNNVAIDENTINKYTIEITN